MRDNLVECCKFGWPVVQGNATFQLWTEERHHFTRRLIREGLKPRISYPVVEGHQLPQTDVSLMELEAASGRPDSISKLSPKMLKLLQTYGESKVEEWKQRAEPNVTNQSDQEQVIETAAADKARSEPGEPIQKSTPLLPRRLMTCAMEESGEMEELLPAEEELSRAEAMVTESADQTMESEPPAQEERLLEENLSGGMVVRNNMNLSNLPTNLNLSSMPAESPDLVRDSDQEEEDPRDQ